MLANDGGHKRTASMVGLKGSRPSSPALPRGDEPDTSSNAMTPTMDGSLDALLSPQIQTRQGDGPTRTLRDSVADGDIVDVDLGVDESHFSNVPLSAGAGERNGNGAENRGSGLSVLNRATSSSQAGRPISYSVGQSVSTPQMAGSTRGSHKKSASSTTLDSNPRNSSGNLPFLLHRLDLQKVQENANPSSHRLSLDGQHRIHEEFSRLQSNQVETLTAGADESIDWDFWGNVMADYRQFASDNPEKLAKAIEQGIPKSLRGMMWQLMSASKDVELEATYLRLLKETSPHEKAILRDLGRTFPHHDYFTDGQGIGQENLFNVLKAYSLYDTEVGYCQGLPFVVAILLLNMPDEEAFCLLVRLMYSYGLRGNFLPEMPGLQLRLYQFDRLVEELLPVLHVHFLRQGVKSSMFCSQWFLTMFSYRFPLDIVFRIYDNVVASGVEAIFGFSVVLLQKNEEALLQLKFDDILAFFKTRLFEQYISDTPSPVDTDSIHRYSQSSRSNGNDDANGESRTTAYRVDEFVQDAIMLKITPFMLDVYSHEYEELVRSRDAHLVEMDQLRNTNRRLLAQVQKLESTLSQLNTEHCEIVKELVMQRLKNEETESELVRYKLLYAESAMQQNEEALTHRRSILSGSSAESR